VRNTEWAAVDKLVNQAIMGGLNSLGEDVKKRAIRLAPKDTGRLRNSGKVELKPNSDTVEISFNTPYAKRRHYENNLHPATKLYLSNALKSITDVSKYFKRSF